MAKKFRKVYLVLDDKNVFTRHNYISTTIYRQKVSADNVCKSQQQDAIRDSKMWSNANKPVPEYKVHAFYLVHEGWFADEQ